MHECRVTSALAVLTHILDVMLLLYHSIILRNGVISHSKSLTMCPNCILQKMKYIGFVVLNASYVVFCSTNLVFLNVTYFVTGHEHQKKIDTNPADFPTLPIICIMITFRIYMFPICIMLAYHSGPNE